MRIHRLVILFLLAGSLLGCPNDQPRSWYNWGGKDTSSDDKPTTRRALPVAEEETPGAGAATRPDEMVIKVNDKKITVEDIVKGADAEFRQIAQTPTEKEFAEKARPIIGQQTWRQVAETLLYGVANRAMNDEAKKHVTAEVKQAEQKLIDDAGGSRVRAEAQLEKRGTTMQEALEKYRRSSTIHLYLQDQLRPKVSVTREMLLRYYQEHEAEFRQERTVQMQLIECPLSAFLPVVVGRTGPTEEESAAARVQARNAIRGAAAALAGGEEFGEVAEKFSRGARKGEKGLWPPMRAGSFKQELVDKVAFSQAEGAVSDVLETPDGYYIVKTKLIIPGKLESFESAQNRIETILINSQMNSLEREHLQELYDKAAVTHPRGFMDEVLNQAIRKYRGGTVNPPGLPLKP